MAQPYEWHALGRFRADLHPPEMTVILSDRTMREQIEQGRIRIEPLAEGAIQPSSIDLRLGDKIRVFQNNHISHIDLRNDTATLTEVVELKPGQPFFLRPLEFALGVTVEHIVVPDDLVARLDGKSSLGRVGLLIHATAGLVDPGWEGPAHAGADEPGAVPDHAVRRHEDRADLVHPDDQPGGHPVRPRRAVQQVPGRHRPDAEPLPPGARRRGLRRSGSEPVANGTFR